MPARQSHQSDRIFKLNAVLCSLLLLRLHDSGNTSTFRTLCELYATALTRDLSYKQYLVRIGELYFGVPKPQRPQGFGNFLGTFMQSLFEDQSSDEDVPPVASSRSGSSAQNHTSASGRQVQADNDLD